MLYFVAYEVYKNSIAMSKGHAITNLDENKVDMNILNHIQDLIRESAPASPLDECDITITAFNKISDGVEDKCMERIYQNPYIGMSTENALETFVSKHYGEGDRTENGIIANQIKKLLEKFRVCQEDLNRARSEVERLGVELYQGGVGCE